MTAIATSHPHRARGYGFGQVARMEWIKLRSLRSTWVTLALTVAAAIGISVAVGLNTRSANEDLTDNSLAGVSIGLLLIGVLGVMVATSEYTSGSIKTTLAAIPNRPLVLTAKAAVFGVIALAAGEVASFVSFFGGGLTLRHGIAAPTLSQPGVLRAVVLTGASYCLIGLLGLGLGVIIRHTAVAVAVMVGGVYVAAQARRVRRALAVRLRPDLHRGQLTRRDQAGGRGHLYAVPLGWLRPALPVRRGAARRRRTGAVQEGRLTLGDNGAMTVRQVSWCA